MFERNTLFACPSCTRHVFPSELECPGCGARLRGADGSIGRSRVALMMGLGAALGMAGANSACSDADVKGSGGGYPTGGYEGATAAYGTGPSGPATTTTKASSSSSAGGECDNGTPNTIDSRLCSDCVDCSLAADCSDELAAFQADPDAQAYRECIAPCRDDACFDACAAMYPTANTTYIAVLSCAVCVECPNNCDADANCI